MGDECQEVVTSDILLLYVRMLPEIGQALGEIVLDLPTRRYIADDETAANQVRPGDLIPTAKRVPSGHREEHPFEPERRCFALCTLRHACQERYVEVRLPYRSEVVFRSKRCFQVTSIQGMSSPTPFAG